MDEDFIKQLLDNATKAKNHSLADPWPESKPYVYTMHFLTLVTIALSFFAAYCVHRKTINEAKFFAKLQLIHLFWATTSDILITSLCTPTVYLPYFAGQVDGLFSMLGLDPFFQVVTCLMSLICTASSIMHMLWFKNFMVLPNRHFLKRERVFKTGLFLLYPLWGFFSVASWYSLSRGIKEQWIGSLERMAELPSQLFDGRISTVFLLARREQSSNFKLVLFTIVFYILLCITAVVMALYYIAKLRVSSMQTAKLQKRAIKALVAQSLVFFGFFAAPMCILYFGRVFSGPEEKPISVYWSNLAFMCLWLASFMDTTTMILMNEGYRNYLLQITRLDFFFGTRVIVSAPASNASSMPAD